MAKTKKGGHAGVHKKHGPKKHLFKEFKPMIKAFADAGILSKYYNFESFQLACQAKGKRNIGMGEFKSFLGLSKEDKKLYFANLKK